VAGTFKRARSLLQDAAPEDAPHWAWWISEREIDRQEGRALQETGHVREAIPILERAMERTPGAHVGYRNVAAVRLFACYLAEQSWQAAENEALKLIPIIHEMSSTVTLNLLSAASRRGSELPGVPMGLRDALRSICDGMDADPYTL
jgi:tetratricopeptide (TPR) repeat protein